MAEPKIRHPKIWLIHPVRAANEVMSYRESRVGIPFIVVLFMFCAGQSVWLIIGVGLASLAYVTPMGKVYAILAMWVWYFLVWNIAISTPRFNIFIPLGFKAFRWLITQ